MAGEVLTCVEFDAVAGTCTVEAWMPPPAFLPALSVEGGVLLGSAIVACWTLAYAFKHLAKVIRQ